MGYDKNDPEWSSGAAPGITATRLNHLETQYEEMVALFGVHTILIAISDDTPIPLTVEPSRIIGRKSSGNIVALTGAQLWAILSGQAGASISMNSKKITSLLDPTSDQDADTKSARNAAITTHKNIASAHHSKLVFTELAGGDNHDAAAHSTWEDWDISGIIPVGAIYALIEIINAGLGDRALGVRKKGSALNRTQVMAPNTNRVVLTEVSASRVVEIWVSSTGAMKFSVLGHWS